MKWRGVKEVIGKTIEVAVYMLAQERAKAAGRQYRGRVRAA